MLVYVHAWEFYVWFRDIVVCVFVLLLNGLENILNNVRLKFKYIIFSGNHDNHAWSSLWLSSMVTMTTMHGPAQQ